MSLAAYKSSAQTPFVSVAVSGNSYIYSRVNSDWVISDEVTSFTITRSGPTDSDLLVAWEFESANGAIPDADFEVSGAESGGVWHLTIPTGQSSATFYILAIDNPDNEYEYKDVTVQLLNNPPSYIGTGSAGITILVMDQ